MRRHNLAGLSFVYRTLVKYPFNCYLYKLTIGTMGGLGYLPLRTVLTKLRHPLGEALV